ncbi:MAG: PKD domain-containing protein [Salibacteraceae bacterium]|nr:PKD domain-containing protein [Salibacteraceae bacterium]
MRHILSIFFLLTNVCCIAQCPADGLQNGSFNGWSRFVRSNVLPGTDISSINAATPSSDPVRFAYITNTVLKDSFTNNVVPLVAPGMNYSIRIGDVEPGAKGERMTTTFTVSNSNTLLTLKYAFVGEASNNPHEIDIQPLFGTEIKDQSDSVLLCSDVLFIPEYVASNVSTYYFPYATGSSSKIQYSNWRTVSFDLRPYLGQTLTIEVGNRDCVYGSHFSYAYFSFACGAFEADYNFCLKENDVMVSAPPGYKFYNWSNNSGQQTATFQNAQLGDSVFCTLTSDGGCLSYLAEELTATDVTADFSVVFDTSLIAAVFSNSSSVFNANIQNYLWVFGDGDSSIVQNPIHYYDSFGIYDVTLYAFNDSGCIDSTTRQYINYPPAYPEFEIADTCGLNVQFIDLTVPPLLGEIDSYFWEFGDGKTSGKIAPNHSYAEGGKYTVRLTVVANAVQVSVFEKEISIYPFPEPNFRSEPACIQNPTQFFDRSSISLGEIVDWKWRFGQGVFGDSATELVTFAQPGFVEVQLTVTSDANCVADTTKEVEVYPQTLNAKFGFEKPRVEVLYPFSSILDSSVNAVSWQWFVDSVFYSNEQNPYLSFEREVADYNVFLVIENDFGCVDTASKTFVVEPIFALYFPNACTPDGDGINDEYVVRGEGVNEFQIIIRDRWGKQLVEGNALNEPVEIPTEIGNTVLQYEAYIIDKNGLYYYREGLITVIR